MAAKIPPSARPALPRAHREDRDFHGQRAMPLLQRGADEVREGWGPHADAAVAASAFLAATVAAARAGSSFLAATVAAARAGSATRRRNTAAGADLRALRCAGGSLRANGRYDGSDDECPWGRRRPGRSGAGRSGAGASTSGATSHPNTRRPRGRRPGPRTNSWNYRRHSLDAAGTWSTRPLGTRWSGGATNGWSCWTAP